MPETQGNGGSMVERVKRILLQPKAEWERIDSEPMTVGGIFTGWVLILAAIPAVAALIGSQLFGFGMGIISIRPSIGYSLSLAVTQYVGAVVGIFVLALIIDALAPTFGGTKNQVQATKVAAYAATASWVAGIFMIIPALGALIGLIGAVYSLYLLYLGLPLLMKVAAEKAVGYVLAVIVAAIVLWLAVGFITSSITGGFGRSGMMSPMAELSRTIAIPAATAEPATR